MAGLDSKLRNSRYMQYTAAVTATLSIASAAPYVIWPSPTLPKLLSDDSPIGTKLTSAEASWVASIALLGAVLGSILAGSMADKLGRKTTLLLTAIPIFLPWIAILFATSAWTLIIARLFGGAGGGIATVVIPMYVGEIADKEIRGRLGTMYMILYLSGTLYVLCVGPFVSYAALAITCAIFPLVFAALFYFMPESPYFLIKAGRRDLALTSLVRLSPNNIDGKQLDERLDEIRKTVECDMQNKSTLWEALSKKQYRKAFIVTIGVRTIQHLSGANALNSYMQIIVKSGESTITPEISSIIFGAIQLPAALTAGAIIDRTGRKPLLIISSLGCALALFAEGIYFYLQDALQANVTSISWVPTTGLVVFLLMASLGILTLPYVLVGELFPTNIKSKATIIFTVYGSGLSFVVIKLFAPVTEAWGMYTAFWIFACVCTLGALFVFVVVPETKGKTFAEIQEKLNRGNNVQAEDCL